MRANLEMLYERADAIDRATGLVAYQRYHDLLQEIAASFQVPLDRVCAVFAAVSPNNDYVGNLRSTVSILDGWRRGLSLEDVQISTYRHCGRRAWSYLIGDAVFLDDVKGLKIRNFYANLLDPKDPHPVTIDGHMVGVWQNSPGTMKELIIKPSMYRAIAEGVRDMAYDLGLVPHQLQATLWFARKRLLNIRYEPQLSLMHPGDPWRVTMPMADIRPYSRRAA